VGNFFQKNDNLNEPSMLPGVIITENRFMMLG